MTLDMFMTDNFKPFTDGHIEALRSSWKKLKPGDNLFDFNKNWQLRHFKNECSREQLEYIASLNIVHYSEWAKEVLNEEFKLG